MMNYSSALLSSISAAAAAAAAAAASGGTNGSIRRTEVPGLPKGWIREEIPKYNMAGLQNGGAMNGSSSYDVVYYSPKVCY